MCDLLIPGLIIAGAALALGNAGNCNTCEPAYAPQPVAYAAPAPCAPQAPVYGAPAQYASNYSYSESAPVRYSSRQYSRSTSTERYTAGSQYSSSGLATAYGPASGSWSHY